MNDFYFYFGKGIYLNKICFGEVKNNKRKESNI